LRYGVLVAELVMMFVLVHVLVVVGLVGLVRVSHPKLLPAGTTIVSQEPNVRGWKPIPAPVRRSQAGVVSGRR
jgi:hypothetical protein